MADNSNSRKVVFFIGSLIGGGAERVVCNLANYMCRRGFVVEIILMSETEKTYWLDPMVKKIFLLKRQERVGKIRDFYIRQKRLKQYVQTHNDVMCYIVMLPVTIFMLVRLKKFTRSKIIISERGNPSSYGLINRMLMRYSARRCDGLVVQTKEIGNWFKGVKQKVIIPNAINEDAVALRGRRRTDKKIVAVGRLAKQKNFPMLIRAFAIFAKQYPDYTLEIYGDGAERKAIERLVEQLGLNGKVKLLGYTGDVLEKMSSAACFVLTSEYEGMPNALIEAMCIGLPCIATNCDGGGARALIENGENGILIDKNDITALVEAMERVVEDEALRNKILKNAKGIVKRLASDKIHAEWVKFIYKVSEK